MAEQQTMTPIFVVLLGMPGAGKGTEAALLVQAKGFLHVSSGQIFRDHVARGTEFGKLAAEYMAQGRIGPDDVIVKM
jgi:adenylate kinase